MNLNSLFSEISLFSKETHGSSDYDKDEVFVKGENSDEFAPFSYLSRRVEELKSTDDLVKQGFIFDSYDLVGNEKFQPWFERQFSRKLIRTLAKKINILHMPANKAIFDAIETIHKNYDVLRAEQILLNGKNLPVQLGEWFAKCIFGLMQIKSTSQRGFDFQYQGKKLEVKVAWNDQPSPKGVKLRKTQVELSEYVAIIYLASNFMIREICFLDSSYIARKFSGKGHTIFLKDSDISDYFFSRSNKHYEKVVNSNSLLKFSSPTFAMKIAESFQ